ncbi:MAG: hypothetical protein KGN79_09225 [Acidobacteriota bacterium]|nr:hypothetical protein [Acidobacteriota bacterium]
MTDLINLILFATVSVGALTLGVGLAFAILKLAFASMAPRREKPAAKSATVTAKVSA